MNRESLQVAMDAGCVPEVWIRFPRQLGDVIFSVPFFGSLRRSWNAVAQEAGVKLRWVAVGHDLGAALFSEAHPDFIAESLIEGKHADKPDPWQLFHRWRSSRPLAVINLSQSVRLALAAWVSRVPIRAGDTDNHLGFLYHHQFTYRDLNIHITERFRPLLKQLTGSGDLRWEPLTPDYFGGQGVTAKLRAAGWDGRPYVTLAFGTRGHAKRWFPEEEKWPGVARILRGQGLGVVWLGGPDEVSLGRELAALVPGTLDLTGQTTIPEACAAQFGAYGNVAVDTGLAHTAAATGRPTLTLLGASPDPLINPVGPRALGVRGPAIETLEAEPEFDTRGNSMYRLQPERIVNLLHALAAEAAGRPVLPFAEG